MTAMEALENTLNSKVDMVLALRTNIDKEIRKSISKGVQRAEIHYYDYRILEERQKTGFFTSKPVIYGVTDVLEQDGYNVRIRPWSIIVKW